MNNSPTTYRRRGGILLIAGAVRTIAGALLSAVVQGSSSVPDNLVRYPFSHDSFRPFAVFAAACHLLMLGGVVYLARSGLAGDTKTGRIGLTSLSSPVWRCYSSANGRSYRSPTSTPQTLDPQSSTADSASPHCSSPAA